MAGQAVRPLPNPAYGEGKDFAQIQQGAEMAQQPGPQVTPLNMPTTRPDEPVTAGSVSGPGGGPESIGLSRNPRQEAQTSAGQLAEYLPALEERANQPGVPADFVRFVRYLRAGKNA